MKSQKIFDYKKNKDWAKNITIVMQFGLTMVGCIAFCFFIGRRIDLWLNVKGIFSIIFTILGVAGGANIVYREIIKITDKKETDKL